MRCTEISLSLGRTINIGNYNSVRAEFSTTYDLEPNDDREEALERLLSETRRGLERAVVAARAAGAVGRGADDERR